jgi:hypothetical protein
MFSTIKAKLDVAEMILKTLNIEYKVVPPETHTSRLKRTMFQQPLSTIHDMLISSDMASKKYVEQFKKDFEARKYWRKQFQKFQDFKKKN